MLVTMTDVKAVADRVIAEIDPESVILFGSVAEKGRGNDLDLLIITRKEQGDRNEVEKRINAAMKPFYGKFAIDPFTISIDQCREYFFAGSPFLRLIQRKGKVMYMKNSLGQWIEQAKEELKTAEYLFKGGYFRGACFHAQQAAEKTIKGVLIKKGWELEKIHNLQRLSVIAGEYKIKTADEDDFIFLDSIYRSRYPAEEGLLPLGEPGVLEAKRAIKIAKGIVKKLVK